jgi:ABC-2 type transport system permease protein
MTNAGLVYTRFEMRRLFRNKRFFFFSLGFPLIFYFVLAVPNRNETDLGGTGVSAPLYYMISLASFGTMMAMVTTGARIAGERQVGWTRQLRITPLSARSYLRAKVLTAYSACLLTVGALYVCGAILGVSMPVGTWVQMTVLIVIALLPFAALGIFLGHLLNVDAVGPASGGTVSLLTFVSGAWYPVQSGVLHQIAVWLPSYWLVQAGRLPIDGQPWGAQGWGVVIGWTLVLGAAAAWAYRRDTGRV